MIYKEISLKSTKLDYLKSRNILDTVSSIFNDRFIMYERIIRIENQGVTLNLQAIDYPRKI